MIDEKIEKLKLRGYAKKGAYTLKAKHPGIEFTSGLRDRGAQARAMAENIIKVNDRQWIKITYRDSPIRERLQGWVDVHAEAVTKTDLAVGFLTVLNLYQDEELLTLSRHFSGEAFDILPSSVVLEHVEPDILSLEGLHEFLEYEGGLRRLHCQFNREQNAGSDFKGLA